MSLVSPLYDASFFTDKLPLVEDNIIIPSISIPAKPERNPSVRILEIE